MNSGETGGGFSTANWAVAGVFRPRESVQVALTVIGPAVNLTARIAGLCRPLGRQLLTSARFASPCGSQLVSLGHHTMRGLAAPQEIFGLPGVEVR